MSRLPGTDTTLATLRRLADGLRTTAARAAQLDAEHAVTLDRLERQAARATAERRRALDNALSEADARHRAAQAQCLAHAEQRTRRVREAHAAALDARKRAIETDESRAIFQIQRDLLQASRDRDAAKAAAEQALAAFTAEAEQAQHGLAALQEQAKRSLAGYPRFLAHGAQDTADPSPPTGLDPAALLAESRAVADQARHALDRFRRQLIPRGFALTPPAWLLALLALLALAAVFLPPLFQRPAIPWPQAAIAASLGAAFILALHYVAGRLAQPSARQLLHALQHASALLASAETSARSRFHHTLDSSTAAAATRTAELEALWNQTRQSAESRRSAVTQNLLDRRERALRIIDSRRQAALARFNQQREDDAARARELAANGDRDFERHSTQRKAELAAELSAAFVALKQERDRVLSSDWLPLEELIQDCADRLPDWNHPSWTQWSPPEKPLDAALFGSLLVDLATLTGNTAKDPRLPMPCPAEFQLPLLLALPDQGSLVIETDSQHRTAALDALNQVVLRLLAGSPPGHALFTLFDPVGLGESFAGLMHLADHEDRIVNRRIWTQPDQIEQRLADLNEHVEKVTQLYLRNAYRSIAEYNAQAGRIAEAFHFLVVADFPANFTETALRRLLSLATSGPRCGVFLLLHWDQRRPTTQDIVPNDLRQSAISIRPGPTGLAVSGQPSPGTTLALATRPDPTHIITFLQQVGRASVDSNRVEMPFRDIAPSDAELWSAVTAGELRVPIGITGATRRQWLALGKATRQHALVAGKTGSGKSTLFHVLITNLALWHDPRNVQFYLVDFKKGVEFKCYAALRLPHARVVAIESDREFALSVLQHADAELHRRGDLFRHAGAQDLPGYLRSPQAEQLPRTVLLIDEFQEFFTEDDRIAQGAALLLDRLVRQGRAFGIHVILGSQTLGGAYTLARTTLGQMAVRIALQCNEADALLIMDENNTAPRLLSRPGEAIYNDAAGALEGNSPFQITWIGEEERDDRLRWIRHRADAAQMNHLEPVVFEGNAPANVRSNSLLADLLAFPPKAPTLTPRAWLGAPNSIKGPTEVPFLRQSGSHFLIIGQNDESSLALLATSLLSLAAHSPGDHARFYLVDATPAGTPQRAYLDALQQAMGDALSLTTAMALPGLIQQLTEELSRRADPAVAASSPPAYLLVHHLERFRALRFEEDFGISLPGADTSSDPAAQFNRLLPEAAPAGIHVLATVDTYTNALRSLGRRALGEFDFRALFQMSAADSASLIDSPKASTLGLHRALLHNAREGSLETFRPYALPDAAWLNEMAASRLRRPSRPAH